MEKQDDERKKGFKKHEIQKEHERREKLKAMDEEHRKKAEEQFKEQQDKHHEAAKQLHHPVSTSNNFKHLCHHLGTHYYSKYSGRSDALLLNCFM